MNKTCIFQLTDSERDRLGNALVEIAYDPHGSMGYITDLRMIALSALPRRIVDALSEQRASINPRSHLIFENLPTDEQIFTTPAPEVFTPAAKSGHLSENLIMAFASLIGEPYSIFFEGADIVNNLIPTRKSKGEYTGLGSEVELDFHIENAALKFMDDYNFSPLGLLLTGVRHDPQGPLTRLADARAALERLTPEDIECLRMPLYRIKVPYRWRRDSAQQTGPVSLVRGSPDLPEISAVFYPDMVEPTTSAAAFSMEKFYAAIREVSFGIDIVPGRLVYIDNRFTLHSRDKFNGTYDEAGNPMRWVQRVFVAPNLWNHRNLNPVKSRVFQPKEAAVC
ncbi:TauD/TfdA family dioxygenase [Trinickia acidisoli]|uniref:TauD/TfdA family dioxygenase n=1 Tax=Trinickia acidisoli TaxID=2767482 RepID=UPI001A8FD36C|nr:TauD/TfdA family dioxygenase [Trinickia acidisoli]